MFFEAEAYERFMGRWSRLLAAEFVRFASVKDGDRLLDAGSGTGSLSLALAQAAPRSEVAGIDLTPAYVEYARRSAGPRLRFDAGDAQRLPYPAASFDHALSLLVMNFIPDPRQAAAEMRRVTRSGGRLAACVWDYAEGMEMLRVFWDAAVALDPAAEKLDERRLPLCRQGQLAALWKESGLRQIEETALTAPLRFASFEDYWEPFLLGQGPAGVSARGLTAAKQTALRERLRQTLRTRPGGLVFQARAWAVKGVAP